MNILITDISSYKAIVITKYLKERYKNIKIIVCDTRKISIIIHTKYNDKYVYLQNKISDEDRYLNSLFQIIKNEGIDICIPVNSREIKVLMNRRKDLPSAFNYLGDYDQFNILDNKKKLIDLARTIGIKIPISYSNISDAVIPFVLKPKNRSSSKGVKYFFQESDKKKVKENINSEDYVIQEFIEGFGVGYSGFSEEGKMKIGFGHKRLCEFPVSGGSSVYRENFINKEIEEISTRILMNIKWSGFIMFEFKVSKNNEIYLIEANPRIWGSINQGLQNGINYFKYLIPNENTTHVQKSNIRTYFAPLLYFSLFKYLIEGRVSKIFDFIRNKSHNKADVNLFDDFLGWLSFLNIIYEKN